MKSVNILLSSPLLLFFVLRFAGACERLCSSAFDGPDVKFPFHIIDDSSSSTGRCGFGPDFGLTCRSGRPVLNLPTAGDFVVASINYGMQSVVTQDPEHCLPRRLLDFNISKNSPFRISENGRKWVRVFECNASSIFNGNCKYGIVAVGDPWGPRGNYGEFPGQDGDDVKGCHEVKKVLVSVGRAEGEVEEDGVGGKEWSLELTWDKPDCRACALAGGTCGYKHLTGSDVGCANRTYSMRDIIVIATGGTTLVVLCSIIFFCVLKARREERWSSRNRRCLPKPNPRTSSSPRPNPNPRPRTGPNAPPCGICLSEYDHEAGDAVKALPCGHCFHVGCIDEWLRRQVTCPVCRNGPPVTPQSSPSFSP